tara:strand:+ start:968 stop:2629 length:1662 start_codon:yes stop_codon:yes gene_type:complete
MRTKLILIFCLGLFGLCCEKELNISEFSDDFSFYQSELRIEALMLPSDSTAIVRIDRSVRLDEANLYNCQDDDLDWNYYYCNSDSISYESNSECLESCGNESDCILHLYSCKVEEEDCEDCNWPFDTLKTYPTKTECLSNCPGECLTDDVGEDGMQAYDSNNDGDYDDDIGYGGDIAPDDGEGDGIPGCNEKDVDEYDEVLPFIHLDSLCTIMITHENNTCHFVFSENGGEFFDDVKSGFDINNATTVFYGAWTPDKENCSVDFTDYDTEYEFSCECAESSGYGYYGEITAVDKIVRPIIYYNKEQYLDFNGNGIWDKDLYENFTDCNGDQSICVGDSTWIDTLGNEIWDEGEPYEDINQNGHWGRIEILKDTNLNGSYDNDESKIDSCAYENNVYECLEKFHSDDLYYYYPVNIFDISKKNNDAKINYASLFETIKYQAVQYIYDEPNDRFVYYHGHPDGGTDSGDNFINNAVCLMFETVVAEKYYNANKFKYDIYTFSAGFENYYFFSQLDLSDPVRTNLRDQYGNPVMGAFGAMSSRTKYFEVIDRLQSQ